MKWPYYQNNINQINLNHTTLRDLAVSIFRGLCLNFVECESFLESNSPDILALCETNLDDSIDCSNFSLRGYLSSFNSKGFCYYMHGLAVYVKKGLAFARDLSLENAADSADYRLTGFTSFNVFVFCLLIIFFIFMLGF